MKNTAPTIIARKLKRKTFLIPKASLRTPKIGWANMEAKKEADTTIDTWAFEYRSRQKRKAAKQERRRNTDVE